MYNVLSKKKDIFAVPEILYFHSWRVARDNQRREKLQLNHIEDKLRQISRGYTLLNDLVQ